MAYGGSQARGRIGAVAAGLHHSHSNARSGPRLRPTPQLTATPDPRPTGRGQRSSWILVRFVSTVPQWELLCVCVCVFVGGGVEFFRVKVILFKVPNG